MKAKRLQLTSIALIVLAAVIGVQVFLGLGSSSNAAWGQVIAEVKESHNDYLQKLSKAVKAGDLKKASHCADVLDEFWQKLGWLARAQSGPDARSKQQAIIDRVVAETQADQSEQIGLILFTDSADEFLRWLEGIKDETWIKETEYVCKQLEEYAEEMRDAGRDTDLGLTYIEHCLPNFLAFAQWFNELPWQHPEQPRHVQSLLAAIKRDLDLVTGELRTHKTPGDHRFAGRSLEQVQENLKALRIKLPAESSKVTAMLSQIEESLDLLRQAVKLGIEIVQAKHVAWEEGMNRALQTKTDNEQTLGSDLQQGIRKLSDQCEDLVKHLGPSQ